MKNISFKLVMIICLLLNVKSYSQNALITNLPSDKKVYIEKIHLPPGAGITVPFTVGEYDLEITSLIIHGAMLTTSPAFVIGISIEKTNGATRCIFNNPPNIPYQNTNIPFTLSNPYKLEAHGSYHLHIASGTSTKFTLYDAGAAPGYTMTPNDCLFFTPYPFGGSMHNLVFAINGQSSCPQVKVKASSNTICSGSSTTLTASGCRSYSWNTGATTHSINISPQTTTTYSVTGISGPSCTTTNSIPINVTATPILTPVAATICGNSTATLNVSGVTNFTWMPGGISSNNYIVSPLNNTTYTVTSQNGLCSSSKTISVIIFPKPTVTASSYAICSGASTTLTASGCPPYLWSTGATTHTMIASPQTTTTYTVTGKSGNDCTPTNTITINVTATPTLQAVATPTSICDKNTATLSASGGTNYTWIPGGITSNTYNVSPLSNTTYTVTSQNGLCSSSKTISVYVFPTPTIAITPQNTIVATGSSITLTGNGAITYTWSTESQAASISVSPTITTTYSITGSSVANCTNTATTKVYVLGTNNGAALNFDGNLNNYVNCGNNTGFQTSSGTIEAWFQTADAGNGLRPIITKQFAWGIFLNDNSLCIFDWTSGSCNGYKGLIQLNDNTWHHIAFAFQSGVPNGSNIYLDGNLVSTITFNINKQIDPIVIGGGSGDGSTPQQFFNGNIDEVRIWNRALCIDEIQGTKNCSVSPTTQGLISYYKFNQGNADGNNQTITTLNDETNRNNGTLFGYTLTGILSNWTEPGAIPNSAAGCTFNSNRQSLSVSSSPIIPPTLSSGPYTLIASGASSYSWAPSAGLSATNVAKVIATPTVSTTYIVTGTVSPGCVNSIAIPIQILNMTSLPAVNCGAKPSSLLTSDFDDDGRIDIAVTNDIPLGQVSLLMNNGNGNFGTKTSYTVGNSPRAIANGVFENDYNFSSFLAVPNQGANSISILTSSCIQSPTDEVSSCSLTTTATYTSPIFNKPSAITLFNSSKDLMPGLQEISNMAICNYLNNTINILTSTNSIYTPSLALTYTVGAAPIGILAKDFNGDNLNDLVTCNYNNNTISLLLNTTQSTLSFSTPVSYSVNAGPRAIISGDWDNDYVEDIAVCAYNNQSLEIFKNDGNGVFTNSQTISQAGKYPVAIAAGDLNNDRLPDLVTCNQNGVNIFGTTISVYMNLGGNKFALPANIIVGNGPFAVNLKDVNNDRKCDIIVANYIDGTIKVLLNNN